ncbi:hypothetical protein D3C87_892050 [compost metagenome]
MMPITTMASALMPLEVSSSPTCGPTTSMPRCVADGSTDFSACMTCALCWSELMPFWVGRRICTSREVP